MKRIKQCFLIVLMPILFLGCSNFFKPKKVFKSSSVLLKKYDANKPIHIDNFVFQHYSGFQTSEEWQQQWLDADSVFVKFKEAIQLSPNKEQFIFSENSKNVKNFTFNSSAEYNPKLIHQNEIIRLANTTNGELKLFPLISYVMQSSDHQYHDIMINDPNVEYNYTIYLHVYLIENHEIIYHQARRYKAFDLYPDDIEFRQRFWNEIVTSALAPYFKNVKSTK